MLMQPLDRDALRLQRIRANPFPFVKIDGFLDPAFANAVAASYPTFATRWFAGRLRRPSTPYWMRKRIGDSRYRALPLARELSRGSADRDVSGMVGQMLHEHATTLSAAPIRNRSRRMIECAKDSRHYLVPSG